MLKALNVLEIEILVESLNDLLIQTSVPAQLQDVWTYDQGLVLHFWKNENHFLVMDMKSERPFFLHFTGDVPLKKGKVKKPIDLFISSHGKNLHLMKIQVLKEFGRVIELVLAPMSSAEAFCRIEASFIPHGENILAFSGAKKSFWSRPSPLVPAKNDLDLSTLEVRSLRYLKEQWLEYRKSRKISNKTETAQDFQSFQQRGLEKKRKAISMMEKESLNQGIPFHEFGNHLKTFFSKENEKQVLESAFQKFPTMKEKLKVDEQMHSKNLLAAYLQESYRRAKLQEQKKLGASERIQKIKDEIVALEKMSARDFYLKKTAVPLKLDQAKTRKLDLPSGATAYIGKSAQDNLKIIKAAKSWDFWLHLRDYPSSHAVIHREKNQSIGQIELYQVVRRLIEETFKKRKILSGEKFDIVMTECRYVRPLKVTGKVTYTHEQKFTYTFV